MPGPRRLTEAEKAAAQRAENLANKRFVWRQAKRGNRMAKRILAAESRRISKKGQS